jgi:hypothetical protein
MMEDHEFCDSCPGCRPALATLDGKKVPDDDPKMVVINKLWDTQTTYAQRRAFIEVTLKNSRKPNDMRLCQEVMIKIQETLKD